MCLEQKAACCWLYGQLVAVRPAFLCGLCREIALKTRNQKIFSELVEQTKEWRENRKYTKRDGR